MIRIGNTGFWVEEVEVFVQIQFSLLVIVVVGATDGIMHIPILHIAIDGQLPLRLINHAPIGFRIDVCIGLSAGIVVVLNVVRHMVTVVLCIPEMVTYIMRCSTAESDICRFTPIGGRSYSSEIMVAQMFLA